MTTTPTLRASTARSAMASATIAGARLVSGVWLARALPTAGNGAVIFILWLATSAYLVCGLGLATSLQRALGESLGRGGDEATSLILTRQIGRRLLAALATGAAALAVALLAEPTLAPAPWWLPPVILLTIGLENLGSAAMAGRQQFARLVRFAGLSAVIQIPAVAIGCQAGGAIGGALGFTAGSLPLACHGVRLIVGRGGGGGDPQRLRPVLGFALQVWLTGLLAAFVWTRMELYLIGHFVDTRALALYGVALAWAALVSQPPMLLLGALMPHFSAALGRGELAATFRTYRQATVLLAIVLAPTCLCAAAMTPVVLPLIYGPAYAEAIPTASVLAAAGIWLGAGVGSSLIYALARGRILLVTGAVGAGLALGLGLILIPSCGILGAAWARCAIQGLMVCVGSWCLQALIGCPVPIGSLVKVGSSATLAAILVAGAIKVLGPWGILAAAPAAAVYFFALRVLRVLKPGDVELVRSLADSLPRWAGACANTGVLLLAPRGAAP